MWVGNPPGVFTPLYETVVLSEVVGSGFTIAPVDGLYPRVALGLSQSGGRTYHVTGPYWMLLLTDFQCLVWCLL